MKRIKSLNKKKYKLEAKSIQFFNSFEDSNEADVKVMSNISCVEHLKNATEMIKKVYANELKNPMDKNLQFVKEMFYFEL